MKYKIGQQVHIRPDLEEKRYESCLGAYCYAIRSMVQYRGNIAVIERVFSDDRYRLVGLACFWVDDMLMPANATTKRRNKQPI